MREEIIRYVNDMIRLPIEHVKKKKEKEKFRHISRIIVYTAVTYA